MAKCGQVYNFKSPSTGKIVTCKSACKRKVSHSAAATTARRRFAAAGRNCAKHHKPGTKSMGACVRSQLRGSLGRMGSGR